MISVEEALNILKDHPGNYGIELIDLHISHDRILREDIFADRDMPPFDRVSMDGIAIRYETFEKGTRTFSISGMAAAGTPQQTLNNHYECLEIMTGSILPLQADTIIPYEWLNIENGNATIIKGNVIRGQNVHMKGFDRKPGNLLIPAGRQITATETGVLAAVGKIKVAVSRLPNVMIISTGDEVVEIDKEPLPHQVRMSNVHQLKSALREFRIEADISHLKDEYDLIKNKIGGHLNVYDIIIINGGVSAGKFDYIPAVLEASGVQKHFYKISQRPGKPFWFGTHANGCTVFAIPGNPVSSFLCCVRYLKPWLLKSLQKEDSPQSVAKLSEDVTFTPELTYFLPVRLEQNENAETIATPVKGHGSGDLANLADTDAFLELPRGKELFRKGDVFPIYKFRM